MRDKEQPGTQSPKSRGHGRVVASLVLLVAAMGALSYAAVPLYRMFCESTGYGGATKRASAASQETVERRITVRFDANVSSELKWDFRPEQREITLKIGENSLAFYRAQNMSDAPLTGTATFNVTPEIAGSYFNKVQCFCFTEQTLAAGQTADFPVSFFIDPAILNDPDARNLEEITLSYTFFRANKSDVSTVPSPGASGGGAASRSFEKSGASG